MKLAIILSAWTLAGCLLALILGRFMAVGSAADTPNDRSRQLQPRKLSNASHPRGNNDVRP